MPKRTTPPAVVLEPVMASPVMRSFDCILRAVAAKHVTVTVVGESGAGKEIMALRLHDPRQVAALRAAERLGVSVRTLQRRRRA